MRKLTLLALILAVLLPLALWAQCANCPTNQNSMGSQVKLQKKALSGYNKANWIDASHYFTYSFVKKPKLGPAILKVKVFTKDKKVYKGYEVLANADMPSMPGMHSKGEQKMPISKKGEYLLPVNFVMPGVWAVDLKFVKDGKQALLGSFELKI